MTTTSATAARPTPRPATGAWLPALGLFLASLAFYAINLDRMPFSDELHHVLAARGMAETGEPRIAEGFYTRGLLYTWLVARSFELFGVGLWQSRLPSVVAAAILVPLLFLWLRREAGAPAAWIGAVGFALSPFAVEVAQFSRFYAPQTLAFFAAAVLVYEGLRRPGPDPAGPPGAGPRRPGEWRRAALFLALALPPLALAVNLQPTTLLGLAGLGLWAAAALLLPVLSDPRIPARRRLALAGGLAAAALLALALAWLTGILGGFWTSYRSVPVFNEADRDAFWFYHARLVLFVPSLWTLSGVVAAVALASFPRPAWFVVTVFAVSFLLNSFAGPKGMRYLAYAQPFLFALWGMAASALAGPLAAYFRDLRRGLAAGMGALASGRERAAGVVLGLALLSVLATNPIWLRTITVMADIAVPGEVATTDWRVAEPALRPLIERAEIVVTTEELGTLYFYDRYDVRFSPSKLGELAADERREFGLDFRTGRPVIGTRASLEAILACYRSGVVLGPSVDWGKPHLINRDLEALIAASAEPVPLPRRSHMTAYAWERPAPREAGPGCEAVREAVARRPAAG